MDKLNILNEGLALIEEVSRDFRTSQEIITSDRLEGHDTYRVLPKRAMVASRGIDLDDALPVIELVVYVELHSGEKLPVCGSFYFDYLSYWEVAVAFKKAWNEVVTKVQRLDASCTLNEFKELDGRFNSYQP